MNKSVLGSVGQLRSDRRTAQLSVRALLGLRFVILLTRNAPNPFRCLSDLCLSLPRKVLGVPVVYAGLDDSVASRTSGANSSVRPHAGNGGLGRHHCHERGSSLSVAPRRSVNRHTHLRKGPLECAVHWTKPPAWFHDNSPIEMLIGHVRPAFSIDSCFLTLVSY